MKVWKSVPANPGRAAAIRGELGLPPPAAELLAGLDLSEPCEIRRFLKPRLADLSDPRLLPGMDAAVGRLLGAIDGGEDMAVFGDYDVDGVTGAALLTAVLRRLGAARVVPCLPDRQAEGYGLSPAALGRCLQSARPRLVVTVDCGSSSPEAVALAARQGVEVIVTDHHEVRGEPVAARAVVNPKLAGPDALKILAGVGVAFKLCHALVKEARRRGRAGAEAIDLREFLDWVAVGTVADIVPLRGENRILVRHGLAGLNRSQAPGWRALIEVAGFRQEITARNIAFGLGPRLNAAGRLGTAERSLELLLTGDPGRARAIARELDAANRERQEIEARILSEAMAEIDARHDPASHFGIVVGRTGWHPGVIGIVASRLAARYRRPVAVVALDGEGAGRGSCRSIEGYDLLGGLEQCREHLVALGGHGLAAGLEIEEGKLGAFRERFNAVAARALSGRDLRPVQPVHAWVDFAQLDGNLLAILEQFEPFGEGNPRPVLAARGVRVAQPPRVVGGKHLRLTLASDTTRFSAIGFGMAEREIPSGLLDAAFHLQRDTYNGGGELQLNLQDIRPAEANGPPLAP